MFKNKSVCFYILFLLLLNCVFVNYAKANIAKETPIYGMKCIKKGVKYKKYKRWLNGRPAIVNILTINPKESDLELKLSYGGYNLNSLKGVKEFVIQENAIAGVNASFFKPDLGSPLGLSIINGDVLTGPLYRRVSFGITKDNKFLMDKVDIKGNVSIGDSINLPLHNINNPLLSRSKYSVFTSRWASFSPKTSSYHCHIAVKDNKVLYVKRSSIPIPENGFVIVGSHKALPKYLKVGDQVSYNLEFVPERWDNASQAISGGPYLLKKGRIFVDRQRFTNYFISKKAPRTAIGYTKGGTIILVTIDGRQKNITEGATLEELAQVMRELGAYNAMNLDGGTSTQMVIKDKIVSSPAINGGARVTNAFIIKTR